MGNWDDIGTPRYGGQPAREPSDACAADGVLAAVLRAAAESHDDDPVAAALNALVTALGLSRASLASVRDDGDLRRLEPIAAAGEHASFARDMPAIPLEQMADAAVAVTERRAHYLGDVHGLGVRVGEPETGVARWRSGMSAQAHALLPVIAHDQVIGVLTLEWSTPQAFSAEERESLEGVALLFGLILWASAGTAPPPEPAPETPTPEPTLLVEPADRSRPVPKVTPATTGPAAKPDPLTSGDVGIRLFGYGVTANGFVEPDVIGGPLREDLALRIAIAAGEERETSCPFWEVVAAGPDTVAIACGTVQAPRGGAGALAVSCAATLRTALSHGRPPAEALRTLGTWLLTSGPGGAWVSAGCWSLDRRSGTLASSAAGAVVSAQRTDDGRTSVSSAERPALGVNAGPVATDSYGIVLPGDSLVVCAGSVAWARVEAGRTALARALADEVSAPHTEGTLYRLAALSADSSVVPLVALIQLLGS